MKAVARPLWCISQFQSNSNQNRPGKNLGLPAIAVRYAGLAKSTLSSKAIRWEIVATYPTQPSSAVIHAVWISGSENISTKTAA